MQKPIDVDKIFESYLKKHMTKNAGKFTEEEWEDKMPKLYEKFGESELKELGGKTPRGYYSEKTAKELVELLKAHVEEDVSVPDFLCDALIAADDECELVKLIDKNLDEELVSYAINILSDKNSEKGFDKFIEFILDKEVCEDMKELVSEILADNADAVKEKILAVFSKAAENKPYLVEILVNAGSDDRIFNILETEFKVTDNLPLYAQYFTKYGDDRALPLLLKRIADDRINYLDFKELKCAIEALGGEYNVKRDFTGDKFYKRIKGGEKS